MYKLEKILIPHLFANLQFSKLVQLSTEFIIGQIIFKKVTETLQIVTVY